MSQNEFYSVIGIIYESRPNVTADAKIGFKIWKLYNIVERSCFNLGSAIIASIKNGFERICDI